MYSLRMATRDGTVRRLPAWTDWVVAVAGGVALLNVNVTDHGDPLSGMTENMRTAFYAVLAIVGTIALCTAVLGGLLRPAISSAAVRAATGFGFLACSAIAALLLDQREGPVRTVQLLAYVGVCIGVVRFIHLGIELAHVDETNAIGEAPTLEQAER